MRTASLLFSVKSLTKLIDCDTPHQIYVCAAYFFPSVIHILHEFREWTFPLLNPELIRPIYTIFDTLNNRLWFSFLKVDGVLDLNVQGFAETLLHQPAYNKDKVSIICTRLLFWLHVFLNGDCSNLRLEYLFFLDVVQRLHWHGNFSSTLYDTILLSIGFFY